MTASPTTRYRLDDLRRLATALGSSLGVSPPRASALATHLLWFDAAGASPFGMASLPGWLGRIEAGEVDPVSPGRAVLEHAGTAVFDAQGGLPPLALETAAGIASEKARDVGVGLVRVRNIGPTGPSAPVASNWRSGRSRRSSPAPRPRSPWRCRRPRACRRSTTPNWRRRPETSPRQRTLARRVRPLGRDPGGRGRLGHPGDVDPRDGVALPLPRAIEPGERFVGRSARDALGRFPRRPEA